MSQAKECYFVPEAAFELANLLGLPGGNASMKTARCGSVRLPLALAVRRSCVCRRARRAPIW
eukprot:6214036-Pleurochrysis_carterae.AAC.3